MEALGAAEVRLYRRPSYGATLVLLAALEAVAPPRPLEAGSDHGVDEVDGELCRQPGMYLALLQGGTVIDVGRLVTYDGEAPGVDDAGADYWEIGSETSEDGWHNDSSNSEQLESSGGRMNYSTSRNDEVKEDGADTSAEDVKGDEDEADTSAAEEFREDEVAADTSLGAGIDSESENDDDGEDKEVISGEDADRDEEERCSALDSTGDEDDDSVLESTSSSARKDKEEGYDDDSGSEMDNEDDEDGDDKDDADAEDADGDDEEEINYALDSVARRFSMWQSTISSEEDDAEDADADDEEDADGADAEGADGDDEEKINYGLDSVARRFSMWQSTISSDEDDAEEDDADGEGDDDHEDRSLKLMLRFWPGKKHISIKFFCAKKWISTKVYRLTWADNEELEELFKSSFEMDISTAISAYTVFRIRACSMEFEVLMPDTPNFDDLVAEFKPTIGDFKFCQKIGGENRCRVFRCLSQGSVFALKTLRLKKPCINEPREVEIISIFKDKRVMAFYQAWVEPWTYKKKSTAYYLFIQLELCHSTLKDKLSVENFESIVDRWSLVKEMLKAVKTAHGGLIVHRDLKPDNIFYGSDMGVRLGDFGDACIGHDEFGGYGGTPNLGTGFYAAPELKSSEKITEKVDIYSVGVMILEFCTKFGTGSQRFELLTKLSNEGLPDDWEPYSELAGYRGVVREMIERMTACEASYRPSAAEMLEYLEKHLADDLEDMGDEKQLCDDLEEVGDEMAQ